MRSGRPIRCQNANRQERCGAGQHEADLVEAGGPHLVPKLEEIRAVIDLEIAYLETEDPSQSC